VAVASARAEIIAGPVTTRPLCTSTSSVEPSTPELSRPAGNHDLAGSEGRRGLAGPRRQERRRKRMKGFRARVEDLDRRARRAGDFPARHRHHAEVRQERRRVMDA
jgi:hypothetical protein